MALGNPILGSCWEPLQIYIDRNALAVLSPLLQNELHFTTAQYSYIVGAFQFCYSLMQPLAGYITDFLGLKLGYAVFACLWGFGLPHARLRWQLARNGGFARRTWAV